MKLPEFLSNPDPNIYKSLNYVVLDFETTTHEKGLALYDENRIVLACWYCGPGHDEHTGEVQHKFAGEFDQRELLAAIKSADFIVAHNAKFELQWLIRCGLDPSTVLVYDTQIAEYVIGGNRWQLGQLSLEGVCQRVLGKGKVGLVSRMIKNGVCPSTIPESWLLRYCKMDVVLCEELMHSQMRRMKDTRLLPVVYTRCLLTPVLADMGFNSFKLDANLVRTKLAEAEEKYAKLTAALDELAPGTNFASPKQVAALLYDKLKFEELQRRQGGDWLPDRTPSGGRRTDADAIVSLKADTKEKRKFIELFIAQREQYNLLSKNLRKFGACVKEGGLLRAELHQCTTTTHRLSSTGLKYGVQLQNPPRDLRPMFLPSEDGWLIGDVDGSQIEFRAACHLGRDVIGVKDIIDGKDVHSATAAIIEVSRQDAKEHTFKPLYGGRSGTKKEKAYYEYFRTRYRGIEQTQQKWINSVVATGQLETEWGLIYYWPDTKVQRDGYVTNSTNICNYPVQAFATAEIVPISLVYFYHRVRSARLRMKLLNTMHDSIVAMFPPDEAESFKELARLSMTVDVYGYLSKVYGVDLIVPLGCEVKIADRWGSKGDMVAYTAPPQLYNKELDPAEQIARLVR